MPSSVEITVLTDRGRGRRGRGGGQGRRGGRGRRQWIGKASIGAGALAVAGLVLLVAMNGALVADRLHGERRSTSTATSLLARNPGPAGVAAAYGYPLRCLSVTTSTSDRAYARADFDHRRACGIFHLFVTAIFRRVGGVWRRAMIAVSYSCPVASLPAVVARELAVCP